MATILVIFAVAVEICTCIVVGNIAEDKGYSKTAWGWMNFFFGPIVWILIAAMPDKILQEEVKEMLKLMEKNDKNNIQYAKETKKVKPVGNEGRCPECGAYFEASWFQISNGRTVVCPRCNSKITLDPK